MGAPRAPAPPSARRAWGGAGLFLSRSGQCVKHLDCTGYQLAGMLQQGVNDFVSLGLEMVLKNGKTSKNVKCLVDEDDNLYVPS